MSVYLIHVVLAGLTMVVFTLIALLIRDGVGERVRDLHPRGRDEASHFQ